MKRRYGFTLIELLIVVAIIAILAAIAVPNFLEAQTRAKVSRALADVRSMVTALETYRIDHGSAPNDYNTAAPYSDPRPHPDVTGASGILHPGYLQSDGKVKVGLTTPVAYISNCWVRDPFLSKTESFQEVGFDEQVYSYNPMVKLRGRLPNSQYSSNNYGEYYGEYRIGSIGPDRTFYNNAPGETNGAAWGKRRHTVPYDASNGTISAGNLWRSQKNPVVTGRPKADENLT